MAVVVFSVMNVTDSNGVRAGQHFDEGHVEIARAMGAREVTSFPGLKTYDTTRYQSTHVQGGTIMGTSP